MNPHAPHKCAGRLLMALAAISSILLMAACGSSNSVPKPNNEGFNNGNLNGTYVFSYAGVDDNFGVFLAVAGAFTANGGGGIAGGMIDVNGFGPGFSSTAITSSGSSYSVGSDGRGTAILASNTSLAPSITLRFVLTSSSHGLVTEFDGNGTGSGTLDLQNLGTLQGSYAFGLSGISVSGDEEFPLAMVGAFTPSGGSITGLADLNTNGTSSPLYVGLTLTGSVTAGSPGTATLNAYHGATLEVSYNFEVYMVDDTHLKFIENDTSVSGVILAGDAFTQQTSIPTGIYAYTMEGIDTGGGPLAMGGFITSDSTTNTISAGLEDYNDAGTTAELTGFGGSYTAFSGGRTELTLNSIYNGVSGVLSTVTFAAYPSSGGIQLLEIDNGGVTGGGALAQGTPTTFAASQGYGLNLSAFNLAGYEEDDIAEFVANSNNTFNGAEDINDEGSLSPPGGVKFDGTFTPDSSVAGHGSAASTSGEFNFNYYVANNGSTILILETDSNQIGAGAFESQNASGSVAAAHSHMSIMRPAVRSHGALRRK